MRVYETLGSGGILITKKIEGLKKISEELYNHLSYDDLKEIPVILDRIKSNLKFYYKLSDEIFETIKNNHTYINRAELITEYMKI